MCKKNMWYDFASNVIMVEANYYKRATNPDTIAYEKLTAIVQQHPTAKIKTYGKAVDNYNHITIEQMQKFFLDTQDIQGAMELKKMCESKEIKISETGRRYKVNNMGKIRQWFMRTYSEEYKLRWEMKKKSELEIQAEMENQLNQAEDVTTNEQQETDATEKADVA